MTGRKQTDEKRRMWRAALRPTSLLSAREVIDALPGQASDVESWVAQHVRPAAMIGTEPVYAWAEVLHALPGPLTTDEPEPLWPIHELNGPAPLLTTDDVCASLRISRRQLYSLTQRSVCLVEPFWQKKGRRHWHLASRIYSVFQILLGRFCDTIWQKNAKSPKS